MKRLFALVLVFALLLSISACDKEDDKKEKKKTYTTSASDDDDDYKKPTKAPETEIPPEPSTYTYNLAINAFPSNWNPHVVQARTSREISQYITPGFYTYDYNATGDGYVLVPHMATDEPVDITSQYVGRFGVNDNENRKVYLINLRGDLKWENGDKITAYDFAESAKLLLNPMAENYRADLLFGGNMVICNAQNYYKQDSYAYDYANMISAAYGDDEYISMADLELSSVGAYTVGGNQIWFNLNNSGNWGTSALQIYYDYGYITKTAALWEDIAAKANNDGWVAVTPDVANALCEIIAELHGYSTAEGYTASVGEYAYLEWEELCYYGQEYPAMDWSEVGLLALSDTQLVIALEAPVDSFYLKEALTDSWLVHIPTYTACAKVVNGVYTNTYCTSADNTMSYGPYKLTDFAKDYQFKLTKNAYFFDLSADTYMTTDIVVTKVADSETRFEMFSNGQLDAYDLTRDDMADYQKSPHTYYNLGASTYAMVFNPDFEGLKSAQAAAGENINKTILTLVEFRQAMSFAMDRAAFCLATSPMNSPAFGLYSSLIIADPEAGIPYRTTNVAKKVLAKFWGVDNDYGDGKLYADLDEAINSLTGFNLTKAKQLFDAAYDKAISTGLMDEDDKVVITIGTPNMTSSFYKNGYEFIVSNYTEAVKGTKLEGKLEFRRDGYIGGSFDFVLTNNQVDMVFGVGWSGEVLDPYGVMEAYLNPVYQYDKCTDYTAINVTVRIGGNDFTADAWTWYEIMNGTSRAVTGPNGSTYYFSCGAHDGDPDTRLAILGALEEVVLMNYNFIPLMDDATAHLKSMQINYKTDTYIYNLGFGGLKYYTYNYTDAEWEAYVASQDGYLNYR